MDYLKVLKEKESRIFKLESGTVFLLKDLFEGVQWNSFSIGDRLNLGRTFKNLVENKKVPNVMYLGKAENNSAKYIKTKGE